jgi:hypothetical protein
VLDEAIVKELCEKASQESDAEKAAELLVSLRHLIEMESDETRLRIRQILLHYRNHPPIAALVEKPRNSISSFVAALIAGMSSSPDKSN